MRKKIISLLYTHKLLKWLLPIFHCLIGRNLIEGLSGNMLNTTTANIYHDKFRFCGGTGNSVIIKENTDLHYSRITFKGSNNKVFIGKNCFLNEMDIIVEGDNNFVIIGDYAFVMGDTRIYVVDGSTFKMGKGCMLSDHIEIRTTDNHSIIDKETGQRINYEEDIVLHDRVWIGTGVTILKGAELPEGCIVGAASVVTRKFYKPHSVIAGNPCREVKENVDWLMERV